MINEQNLDKVHKLYLLDYYIFMLKSTFKFSALWKYFVVAGRMREMNLLWTLLSIRLQKCYMLTAELWEHFILTECYIPMTAAILRNCPNMQLWGGLAPASLENKIYNKSILITGLISKSEAWSMNKEGRFQIVWREPPGKNEPPVCTICTSQTESCQHA